MSLAEAVGDHYCDFWQRPHRDFVPREDEGHIELLAMVTGFHSDLRYEPLECGRILDVGRPWMKRSRADHLLISLPYTYGPRLEWLAADGHAVQVLWLLPIHADEARFAREHGVEALEQMFDDAELDYSNPRRRSVV